LAPRPWSKSQPEALVNRCFFHRDFQLEKQSLAKVTNKSCIFAEVKIVSTDLWAKLNHYRTQQFRTLLTGVASPREKCQQVSKQQRYTFAEVRLVDSRREAL